MIRLIKRYESRKLYDTEESRYVSLEEIADWIQEGQEIRVVENASSNDVTAQTLTQIILDQGRSGRSRLPNELLHELIRVGERAWTSGVEQVQQGVERLVESSMQRFGPVRRARDEMGRLRGQLRELERSLAALEEGGGEMGDSEPAPRKAPARKAPTRKAPAKKAPTKKAPAKKTPAKATVAKKASPAKGAATSKPAPRKKATPRKKTTSSAAQDADGSKS